MRRSLPLLFALTWARAPLLAQAAPPSVSTAAAVSTPSGASSDTVKGPRPQAFDEFLYPRPHFYSFLTNVPGDIYDDWGETFAKKNRLALGLTVVATAALIPNDQHLEDQAQILGRRWGVQPATAQAQKYGVLYPYNTGSALYFIGDGELHIGLAAGFLAYGGVAQDYRALQTSSEILEAYIASGIIARVIKYGTGRESPYVDSRPGGRWVPFPSFNDALHKGNVYDAFPSGHLTSAMAVFTVINENYSEDYWWIKPVGYVSMAGLMFQMMNNGVHWAGDYPLALFMGYTFGEIAARKGRTAKKDATAQSSWEIEPQFVAGGWGLAAKKRF